MPVEVKAASFGYRHRPVVRVEQLRLHAGRCLGVFGPNGSGKTTLVHGLVGLLPPLRGEVVRQPVRFGYMPQHRAMESHWPMTAADAASMAVSSRRLFGWVGGDAAKVRDAMRKLGVDPLARQSFSKLSGGKQQRVLLAGTVASTPDVLVLDEPTDGLDVRSRHTLLATLRQMTVDGLSTLIVTHDVEDLMYLCDEVAWLHPGDDVDQPSEVELVPIPELAARVAGVGRAQ